MTRKPEVLRGNVLQCYFVHNKAQSGVRLRNRLHFETYQCELGRGAAEFRRQIQLQGKINRKQRDNATSVEATPLKIWIFKQIWAYLLYSEFIYTLRVSENHRVYQ